MSQSKSGARTMNNSVMFQHRLSGFEQLAALVAVSGPAVVAVPVAPVAAQVGSPHLLTTHPALHQLVLAAVMDVPEVLGQV